jgi:hypothetical protein
VFNVNAWGAAWQRGDRVGRAVDGSAPGISFELICAPPRADMLRLSPSGATNLDLYLPTDRPGILLRCGIDPGSHDMPRLRRSAHQTANHRSSALAIAGMQSPPATPVDARLAEMRTAIRRQDTAYSGASETNTFEPRNGPANVTQLPLNPIAATFVAARSVETGVQELKAAMLLAGLSEGR